jgi:hypothetical protein
VSLSISFYYANYTKDLLEKNIVDNNRNNLKYILSNVDNQMHLCQELSDWIYLNRYLEKVLIRDYSDSKYNFDQDISQAYKVLNDMISNSAIGKYVVSVIIKGKNNIDLKLFYESDHIDINTLINTEWFKKGLANEYFSNTGIEDNIAKERVNSKFIPFVRKIIFADTRKQIGWQVLGFSPDLIRNSVKDFEVPTGDLLFLLDEQGRCLYSSSNKYLGENLTGILPMPDKESKETHFFASFLNRKVMIFYEKSGLYSLAFRIMSIPFILGITISVITRSGLNSLISDNPFSPLLPSATILNPISCQFAKDFNPTLTRVSSSTNITFNMKAPSFEAFSVSHHTSPGINIFTVLYSIYLLSKDKPYFSP